MGVPVVPSISLVKFISNGFESSKVAIVPSFITLATENVFCPTVVTGELK